MPLNGERAFELMQRDGVDTLVASSTENVYYISNYWSVGKRLGCGIDAFTILPIESYPALVAPLNEADLILENQTWMQDLRFYGGTRTSVGDTEEPPEQLAALIELHSSSQPGESGVKTLINALEEKGLTNGVIALDTGGLTPIQYERIQSGLKDAELIDGSSLLREMRLVKTEDEIDRIMRATAITEKSMEDALEIARDEITELDLAGMFGYSVAYDGGRVTQNMIGFGQRSAYPNPLPTPREARKRDLVRLTLGCTWDHYHSNISRTAVIGRPLAKARRVGESVIAAQDAALDIVEPGVKVGDLYSAASKELEGAEVKTRSPDIGHGIGIECYEAPAITEGSETELLEGMVINIDISLLELGWNGIQLEDTALVTSDGHELLTQTDRTLYLL
ncbi:MAG: Xaa-Pro peptidase family protein [Candidatus Bathyarchaeota archaeon]|jgi:Xaa-Pro aminopeptidase